MQLAFKVSARDGTTRVHSVLRGTSWNEIDTTGVELERAKGSGEVQLAP